MDIDTHTLVALRDKSRAVVFERPLSDDVLEYIGDVQVVDGVSDIDMLTVMGQCSVGMGPVLIRNFKNVPESIKDGLAQYMKLTGEGFPGFGVRGSCL